VPEKMIIPYCNKCKEQSKADIRQKKINKLKEDVKANPNILVKTNLNYWSENAIKTAVDANPKIATMVLIMYPKSKCYIVHSEEKKNSIIKFLKDHINKMEAETTISKIQNKELIYNSDIQENTIIDIKIKQKTQILSLARQIPVWAIYPNIGFTYTTKPDISALDYNDFLELVSQEPGALEFVPELMRTYKLCLTAMKCASKAAIKNYHMNGEGFPLIHVPIEYRDEQMCLAAASWCNRALWFFPEKMRTLDMYIKCAKLNPSTINSTMPEPFCNHPSIIMAKN
jgi:hypothetical protein